MSYALACRRSLRLPVVLLGLMLTACGSSVAPPMAVTPPPAGSPGETPPPPVISKPEVPVTEDRAGTITNHVLISPVDGAEIPITVFEPIEMKKGGRYPLVLFSHGWGGTRSTARDFFTNNINERGMYCITFDQRGFGASTGMVRAMDPDYEGQDMIAILDWAEKLPGLARFEDGRMKLGSVGGSYGGMYQFALAGSDPEHRLRVIAPDVAPFDINAALYPGKVWKGGWGAQLIAGLVPPVGKGDPVTVQAFSNGQNNNVLSESEQNYFAYHSLRYFCDGKTAGAQSFPLGAADTFKVPPGPLPPIDALITQGFRDSLFNVNHAVDTYDCLRKLGGQVMLFTHQSGHIFSQASITNVPGLEDGIDPAYGAVTPPNSGDVAGNHACGSVNSGDVTWAYFEEKLLGKVGAIAQASKAGSDICISLRQGDAVAVKEMKIGGQPFEIDGSTPQFNGAASTATGTVGEAVREQLLATQVFTTMPAGGGIIAGIPTMDITLSPMAGASATGDPILFLGIGWRKAGQQRFDLVDDQLTPLRGFGEHKGRMVGIAERLGEGDELALLVYGSHLQYPQNNSRDVMTPALTIGGTVALPLLDAAEITKEKESL